MDMDVLLMSKKEDANKPSWNVGMYCKKIKSPDSVKLSKIEYAMIRTVKLKKQIKTWIYNLKGKNRTIVWGRLC